MKSLTGSLLGTAFALALLVPVHGAASQETCSEGSPDERVVCLVQLVTALRLEVQRGIADLSIESQRIEAKFDTDLRDAKRVIQESIFEQTTRIGGIEIQLGTGLEAVKSDIQTVAGDLRGDEMRSAIGALAGDVEALREEVRVLMNTATAARDGHVTLKEEVRVLKNAAATVREVQGTLNEEVRVLKDTITAAQDGQVTLKEEVRVLKNTAATAREVQVTLKEEVRVLKDTVTAAQEGQVTLKEEVWVLKNTAATVRDRQVTLKEEVRVLKNTAATAREVQVTLREDIESGVAGLTNDIEGILREIQERESAFIVAVRELNARLDDLQSNMRAER